MTKEKYISDLSDIKSIMDRSSRFISLSGISGVIAGSLALIAAYLAYSTIYQDQNLLSYKRATLNDQNVLLLLAIATGTLLLSIGAGIFFTNRKAKKHNQKLWDKQAKRLVMNLMIPLMAGGTLCLILLSHGLVGLVAPLTLLFYGMALVNASKYTLSEIRSLGLIEMGLGLLGCQYIGYGLILWAIGFGLLHIIYGIFMHLKYGS